MKDRDASARDRADAVVVDVVLSLQGTPEGIYLRRKMTSYPRRQGHDVGARRSNRRLQGLLHHRRTTTTGTNLR